MEIATSPVERKYVTATIRMVGKVDYDETKLSYITAWVGGRLDRLYVDYTGVSVRKGDHMVYLYSPELYATQQELIEALRAADEAKRGNIPDLVANAESTVRAAREKLRLLGLTPEQVAEVERTRKATDHLTIYSPTGGIVIHRNAQEGMYVQTGTKIYTIADLRQVWVKLDAYESDIQWLRYGQTVEFTSQAYPGETFEGTIAFIDPVLDPKTRTVKVRVNVPNEDGRLKPEMFIRATVHSQVAAGGRVMEPNLAGKWMCPMHPEVVQDEAGECSVCQMPLVKTESLGYVPINGVEAAQPLVIPATAPLLTGARAVVYVQDTEAERPTFVGREIVLGPRAGDYYIVRHGLREGELVVTSGNFKIDSALQILARPSMMTPAGGGAPIHGDGAARLPASFLAQVRHVLAAHAAARGAFDAGDIEALRRAFRELQAAVGRVDGSPLEDDARKLWNELAMLLGNDGVVGSAVKDMKSADTEVGKLSADIERLHAELGVPRVAAHSLQTFEAPQAFRDQLGKVVDGYLALQSALASDKLEAAREVVRSIGEALQAVDMKLLSEPAHVAWMRERPSLQKALADAGKARDIHALRAAFSLLSEELPALVRMFGLADARPLYILECPMAFSNRGATWLQTDTDVRNPYFGAAMYKCGGVVGPLMKGAAAKEGGAHEHR
jgi:Cu(I)/Ag(I) efflux system membrane fusion protein